MSWEEYAKGAANRPLGRIGRAEEIASAVLFLASDCSSFMTALRLSWTAAAQRIEYCY